MATGADEKFWRDARLRSVLKHGIVKRYLPVFLARTSARRGKAIYFDGYAGRGRYENGQLGSSGLMMEFALGQKFKLGREYTLLLYELDRESFDSLAHSQSSTESGGWTFGLSGKTSRAWLTMWRRRQSASRCLYFSTRAVWEFRSA